MLRQRTRIFSIALCFISAILFILFWALVMRVQIARAGSGPIINIPASTNVPVMDGVCNPSEYSDAAVVTITVGTDHPFPVYMKHTNTDAYFCFGGSSGLPLPVDQANSPASVAVYIDPDNSTNTLTDDFGVWVPYDATQQPFASTWVTNSYVGPSPVGWQAVRSQSTTPWSAEFKISNQTLGGMNHAVGLALFYHWWQAPKDDYSWPNNGIWGAPADWANAGFSIKLIYLPLISKGP